MDGVAKREGRAPASADNHPARDTKAAAQQFEIFDNFPRCVFIKFGERRAPPRAALIDELTPYSMTNTSVIQSSPVSHRPPYVLTCE